MNNNLLKTELKEECEGCSEKDVEKLSMNEDGQWTCDKCMNEMTDKKFIDYEGCRYFYEHRVAKHRIDICLATKDPKKYCNGFYLYSDKDSGSGKCFIVTSTNDSKITLNVLRNNLNQSPY